MKVALIMGSDSDFPVMKKAVAIFKEFGVDYEVLLASAHRTPAAVREFVTRLKTAVSGLLSSAPAWQLICRVSLPATRRFR